MSKGIQIEIGFEGEMVTIPLAEYEELKALQTVITLEKDLTKMFDSDQRVGLALLEAIRKL